MCRRTLESLVAGSVGALAMMPFGFFFRALEMRVGHYGPKFAELYLSSPGPAALFIQHMVIGWVSAVPLSLLSLHQMSRTAVSLAGVTYGAVYYVLVNSLALPLYFGDKLPLSLGWQVVVPSLVVHVVFGIAVALMAQSFRRRTSAA
jgi:uncharacterized membrane protein YagU involved in acid resistance